MPATGDRFWIKPYIQNALRRAFYRTSMYRGALAAARVNRKIGRTYFGYACAHCGNVFTRKEIQVDHIEPVIPTNTLPIHLTYDDYIARLFTENLQILCKSCHATKSAEENGIRRTHKKIRGEYAQASK